MPPAPARRPAAIHPLTSADLQGRSAHQPIRPLILVADDHASVASATTRLLRAVGGGGEVLAPVTSLELLARVVPVVAPLVLVADLDFDGVLSLDLLRHLMGAHRALEVIAWSGHDSDVMRQMVVAAGVPRFVAKQETFPALQAAVAAATALLEGMGRDDLPVVSWPPRERRRHDAGPLIRWALDSGFRRSAIIRVAEVTGQTVDHHVKAHSQRAEAGEGPDETRGAQGSELRK